MKRAIDLILSVFLLILLSPLIFMIMLMIRHQMGSPTLFKQQRPGLHGKLFFLYKFRTMNDDIDKKGLLLSDQDRMTSLGLWLRKYSMDEIPQLLNVIKGDMSLVGPRPLLVEYLPLYNEDQSIRHQTRPGITGWAQINGRNDIPWEQKFKLDTWYVKNQTLRLDMKILCLTLLKVIRKEGITQKGHVSAEKFTGSDDVI